LSAVRVLFSQQIDFATSLTPLGRPGDDLLDRFDARRLVRTVRLITDGPLVPYRAAIPDSPSSELVIEAPTSSPADFAAAVLQSFVLANDALSRLAATDLTIAELAERHPHVAPALITDPFAALVRSISAQQINLRFASLLRARLAESYGRRLEIGPDFVYVLEPEPLADANVDDLRELQFTYAKARAVVASARAATAGELRLSELERMDDEQLIAHLTRLPGIGRWSAEWFLARTLGRPRVVAGDLAVRKAVGRLYGVPMPSEDETRRLTEHWGEAATIAQALALQDLSVSPAETPGR